MTTTTTPQLPTSTPRARLPGNISRQLPRKKNSSDGSSSIRSGRRGAPPRSSTSPANIKAMQASMMQTRNALDGSATSLHNSDNTNIDMSSSNTHQNDNNNELPLTWKTKTIKKLDSHTYVFHCTCRISTARINKNMIVIEHQGELTLINPLKLTSEGERKLGNLGVITHLIRLGPSLHGIFEDDYYITCHPNIQRWAPGHFKDMMMTSNSTGQQSHTRRQQQSSPEPPKIDHELKDRGTTPFPNCRVFTFASSAEPEAALLLYRTKDSTNESDNLLITGDCLQSQKDNEFINMPVVAKLKLEGLLSSDIVVSKSWLTLMGPGIQATKKEQNIFNQKMCKDLQRLTALDFSRLLSTSGNVVKYGAKEGAILAVEHVFPMWGSSSHHRSNSR